MPMPDIPYNWDNDQNIIIETPDDCRILVDAGPGTGKTAVACKRVAWLIDQDEYGIDPGAILVISFTRAAIKEIRERIEAYLTYPNDAYLIPIATLDSFAYRLCDTFDSDFSTKQMDYDETILYATKLLIEDEDVSKFIEENIHHLVVDESQDIVGIRSEFVLEIMKCLSEDSGFTVFSDDAQAIYGFSNDTGDSDETGKTTLPTALRDNDTISFTEKRLSVVHRTSNPALVRLFTKTRDLVLTVDEDPIEKYETVRRDIKDISTQIKQKELNGYIRNYSEQGSDSLILFRKRLDVLYSFFFLSRNQNIQHSLRNSWLPLCIHPWLVACLSEYVSPTLKKGDFEALWAQNVAGTGMEIITMERAWDLMFSAAGKTKKKVIDLKVLRSELGRSKPLADFCYPDTGHCGPVLSTIHMSKGRESDFVHLILPKDSYDDSMDEIRKKQYEEEARVMFVGATRGKQDLIICEGMNTKARTLNKKRVYRIKNKNQAKINFEIGRSEDIVPDGIAGTFFSSDDVRKNQDYYRSIAGSDQITWINAERKNSEFHLIRVGDDTKRTIGLLNPNSVTSDLKSINWKHFSGNAGLPKYLNNLRILAVRTMVLPSYLEPASTGLHDPWSRSGMLLAPVVTGFPMTNFWWGDA